MASSGGRGNLVARFRQAFARCTSDSRLPAGCQKTLIGIALSGGSDSMSLARLCLDMRLNVFACHVDHLLRPTSSAEAVQVGGWCIDLGIPCDHLTIDWRQPLGSESHKGVARLLASPVRRSEVLDWLPSTAVQRKARDRRRAMLCQWASYRGISVMLAAHQADDQVETFFLRAAQQSGLQGLQGIPAVSRLVASDARTTTTTTSSSSSSFSSSRRHDVWLLRPLLGFWKQELRDHCAATGVPYLPSPENDDPLANPRQSIRAELRQRPQLSALALRSVAAVHRLNDEVSGRVDAFLETFTRQRTGDSLQLDINRLRYFPLEFVFRVFDRLNKQIGGHTFGVELAQLRKLLERVDHDLRSAGHLKTACTVGCLKLTSVSPRRGNLGWVTVENAAHPRKQ